MTGITFDVNEPHSFGSLTLIMIALKNPRITKGIPPTPPPPPGYGDTGKAFIMLIIIRASNTYATVFNYPGFFPEHPFSCEQSKTGRSGMIIIPLE